MGEPLAAAKALLNICVQYGDLPIRATHPRPTCPRLSRPLHECRAQGRERMQWLRMQWLRMHPLSEEQKQTVIQNILTKMEHPPNHLILSTVCRTQRDQVDRLVRELERMQSPLDLMADPSPLAGRWRLVYSSAFGSGSLGGTGGVLNVYIIRVRVAGSL